MSISSSLTTTAQNTSPAAVLTARWAGLGYEQVPGLANRIISRYLRGQRRNMLRFFTERGMFDLAERMRQIRASRQGMLAKNRMFQVVLNEYSERVTPRVAETASTVAGRPSEALGLRVEAERPLGMGSVDGDSVSEVARPDGAQGIVIEE